MPGEDVSAVWWAQGMVTQDESNRLLAVPRGTVWTNVHAG